MVSHDMGRHRASASPSSRCNPEIDRMEPRGMGWKTGKLKRRPPARSSRGRRLRRSTTRSASVEITPTARTVTGSFSASVGPSIVRVREAACVNTCGATRTPTFQGPNDGKVNPRKLCEQIDADTAGQGQGHLSPLERHFDRETRLRRCGPNCEIAKPPWIFWPRWRRAGSARIHTVKYLGSSRKKSERKLSDGPLKPPRRPQTALTPRRTAHAHRRAHGKSSLTTGASQERSNPVA